MLHDTLYTHYKLYLEKMQVFLEKKRDGNAKKCVRPQVFFGNKGKRYLKRGIVAR